MAKNRLTDLNNILFEQLEKLRDDEYMKVNEEQALKASKAISNIAKDVVASSQLMLDATKHADSYGYNTVERGSRKLPKALTTED